MDLLRVQCLLATNQEDMKQEYAKFVQTLSDYANKEIPYFRCSVVLFGDLLRDRVNITHAHETAQAMLERMDRFLNNYHSFALIYTEKLSE